MMLTLKNMESRRQNLGNMAGEHTAFLIGSSFSVKNDVSRTSLKTAEASCLAGNSSHCHNIRRAPLLGRLITGAPRLHYVADMTALVIDLGVITHAGFEDECLRKRVRNAYRVIYQGILRLFSPIGGH